MPFLQWCSNGWEEDDELRKADYGVGSAAVFVLLVAWVSRQPAVVALPLLFSVVASSLCFCHLVSLQTILCLSLSVSPPFSFFLLLLCVVVLFFLFFLKKEKKCNLEEEEKKIRSTPKMGYDSCPPLYNAYGAKTLRSKLVKKTKGKKTI